VADAAWTECVPKNVSLAQSIIAQPLKYSYPTLTQSNLIQSSPVQACLLGALRCLQIPLVGMSERHPYSVPQLSFTHIQTPERRPRMRRRMLYVCRWGVPTARQFRLRTEKSPAAPAARVVPSSAFQSCCHRDSASQRSCRRHCTI